MRALAVLAVIFAHAGLAFAPGGFVGVDVFFVISGFLISKIIYDEAIEGKFSISRFYERRIRRIFPALLLVILLSSIAAPFILLPDSYENFGQSVVATLFFANNILLNITSGYWDLASHFKPMLHTWSLGLEEQFYLTYPLLVPALIKWNKRSFAPVLVVLLAASLTACLILSPIAQRDSFYMLHTRAWELLLGALAAHYAESANEKFSKWSQPLAWTGLIFVLAPIVVYNESLTYPSFWPIVPCLGSALLLVFARSETQVGKLLSYSKLTWVGLISYSAYLIHQPLFAFARALSLKPLPLEVNLFLIAATLLLAHISWKFVETPFRSKEFLNTKQVFAYGIAGSFILALSGGIVYMMNGFPERAKGMGLNNERFIAYNESVYELEKAAFSSSTNLQFKILVSGNSTARDFVNVMKESGKFDKTEILYTSEYSLFVPADAVKIRPLIDEADLVIAVCDAEPHKKESAINLPEISDKLVVVGPKHFGYNLDAYLFTPQEERPKVVAVMLPTFAEGNATYAEFAPPGTFVDLWKMSVDRFGGFRIFDSRGRINSVDRVHLTKAGAEFFAEYVFENPIWKTKYFDRL